MKNLSLMYVVLASLIASCTTQNELELKTLSNEAIFTKVDSQPTFEGGIPTFYEYAQQNLEYPAKAKLNKVEGKVFIEFIITKTGTIESARVLKGIEDSCDKAALDLISNSPAWIAGSHKGVPVNVKMVLPIIFSIKGRNSLQKNTNFDNITEVLELALLDSAMFSAEAMPKFNGGSKALFSYIRSNIKYPVEAKRAGISGKVLIQFVVKKDGTISDVKLVKGIDEECDLEAIRVIKQMPLWNPGMGEDEPIDVKMILPITFSLG
ncbi:MAG: energy transducer TonB [Cyclobacteriaceae bacterium]|nr:energy transducer TonB [Cyclobacteriaceae bacterium]